MKNPIVWFEIYVNDMKRARAFYEAVFDCKLSDIGNPDMEYWTFPSEMETYGASGALVRMEGVPAGGNSTIVYFMCEDCEVEQKRSAENDGKVFKEKFSIGEHGFIALVHDTEGNMIGLHSMK